jgi:Domain of unknown function (DU1801)
MRTPKDWKWTDWKWISCFELLLRLFCLPKRNSPKLDVKGYRMAENKTKPTTVSVSAFIEAIPDESKRADAKALVKMMQSVSGEKAKMWGPSIIGFGSYHYKYDTGREGDMPLIGFSPRKAANVLYGAIGFKGADALLAKLGKHTTGKGCLYIKKLSDVDQKVLETLVVKSLAAKQERHSSHIDAHK